MYGTKCISVQQKSGNRRNQQSQQEPSEGPHKLYFIDEKKKNSSLPVSSIHLKQHAPLDMYKFDKNEDFFFQDVCAFSQHLL